MDMATLTEEDEAEEKEVREGPPPAKKQASQQKENCQRILLPCWVKQTSFQL